MGKVKMEKKKKLKRQSTEKYLQKIHGKQKACNWVHKQLNQRELPRHVLYHMGTAPGRIYRRGRNALEDHICSTDVVNPNIKHCSSEEFSESHLARTLSNAAAYSSAFWWACLRARRTKACGRSSTSKRSNALLGWLRYLLRLVKVHSVVSKALSCSSAL